MNNALKTLAALLTKQPLFVPVLEFVLCNTVAEYELPHWHKRWLLWGRCKNKFVSQSMNESVIHIDDSSSHPSPSFPLWYVFSDYQRTCCISLHPPPSFPLQHVHSGVCGFCEQLKKTSGHCCSFLSGLRVEWVKSLHEILDV